MNKLKAVPFGLVTEGDTLRELINNVKDLIEDATGVFVRS